MTRSIEDLFGRARERGDIARISGVAPGRRGRCPCCGEGKKKDTAFAHNRNGTWKCFRCDGGGDVIQLVCNLQGFDSRIEAARHILGLPLDGSSDRTLAPESLAARSRREREAADRRRRAARSEAASHDYYSRVIASLDAGSTPASESLPVKRWLKDARGLPVELLPDVLKTLRAASEAHFSEDFETGEIAEHPAMIGTIEGAPPPGQDFGAPIGRHVTYLSHDGRAKAEVDAPRKIWGAGRGGVWLTERDPTCGPLFVAEGIETALSMLVAWRMKHGRKSGRALAVLSLNNLQGGWMLDRFGRMDPDLPRHDPGKPAVTWARMGKVVIGCDHDMAPLRVKVRQWDGGSEMRFIDATRRMEICGRLASFWWRLAGASDVRIARPPLGMDFNDWMRAERGRAAA